MTWPVGTAVQAELDALKAKLTEVEQERDILKARCIALLWRVSDDATCGDLRADADEAYEWLKDRR